MINRTAIMTAVAAFSAVSATAISTLPAEAARCPQGYVYRPSREVCQPRKQYVKQVRARHASANMRHRTKRERPVRSPEKPRNSTPIMVASPAPIWYSVGLSTISQPYGHLYASIVKKASDVSVGWAEAAYCLRGD